MTLLQNKQLMLNIICIRCDKLKECGLKEMLPVKQELNKSALKYLCCK